MKRREYVICLLLFWVVGLIVSQAETSRIELAWIVFILLILGALVSGMRSADIGQSPWWLILYLFPVLNLILGVRLLILPSGYGRHRDKRPFFSSLAGVAIAILGALTVGFIIFLADLSTTHPSHTQPTQVKEGRIVEYLEPSIREISESRERAMRLYPFLQNPDNPWRKKLDDYVAKEIARKERAVFFTHLDWPERIVIEFLAKNGLLNSDGSLRNP